jgi:hypothetical protein
MHDPQQIHRLQKAGLKWLIAYLLTMAAVVWLVFHVRARAMESLDTPAARAEWETWRQAAGEQSIAGPVRRRTPASAEPPTLVLLRDYFGMVLGAAIVFGSALFGSTMIAIRGAYGAGRKPARIVDPQPWNSE